MFTFVTPATDRIDLGDGDWLQVKHELTVGEAKAMRTKAFTYMSGTPDAGDTDRADDEKAGDVKIGVDWRLLGLARVVAYVTDWNAKDGQGRPLPFSREALEQLTETDYDRIEKAIDAHVKSVAAEKKTAGTTTSTGSSAN